MPGYVNSHEVRGAVRWRPQTSYWKARKVAQDSLVVTCTEPTVPNAKVAQRITEHVIADEEARRFRWLTKEQFADLDRAQQKSDREKGLSTKIGGGRKPSPVIEL